jgi:hypothetical protein
MLSIAESCIKARLVLSFCKRHIIWKKYCYFQYLKIIVFLKNKVISVNSCHPLKITTVNVRILMLWCAMHRRSFYPIVSFLENKLISWIMLISKTTSKIRIFLINSLLSRNSLFSRNSIFSRHNIAYFQDIAYFWVQQKSIDSYADEAAIFKRYGFFKNRLCLRNRLFSRMKNSVITET